MKKHLRLLALILMLPAFVISDGRGLRARSSTVEPERVRFRITTVEERSGERNILSETTVEGPPGTDFNINLQSERFKMKAHFLTDLVRRDTLRVRAKLDTRRFYGYSEQRLPLYEEDLQTSALDVGFDEAVVLLPFGQSSGGDTLKIEITPMRGERAARLASGRKRPLEIEITKTAPNGFIGVEAFKVPHRFTVEAILFEDGREVARGVSNNLLEEAQELALQPNAQASAEVTKNPLVVNLSIEQFMRGRPADQAALSFDVYRTTLARPEERQAVATKWAGIADLDSELAYDFSAGYQTGRKYELKFRIRLAPVETSD
ncbi:MAG TPA: hypothetical protein VGC66_10480 [Pyrinomonadaceae bacterium]